MRRRWVIAGAVLGVAAVALVWGAIGLAGNTYRLVFGDGAICSTENPDGYSQEACPPPVIPPYVGGDGQAPVTVEAAKLGGSMEGDIAFVEVTSADGQLVWYQPLVTQPDDWPPAAIGAAHLPRGSYDFTFYNRDCGGTCHFLGPPAYVCAVPVTLEDFAAVVIEWDLSRGEPCASVRPPTN